MADEQPIIVIKKVSGHGGHHGGAWKVAYADFVTAMMALFIVLWLLSSTNKQTQEEIAGYFNDPKGTASKKGSEGKPQPKEESKKDDMAALKADLMKAIDSINMLNKLKKQIEMSITEEGLRIELIEDEKGTFFQVGSAQQHRDRHGDRFVQQCDDLFLSASDLGDGASGGCGLG